MREQDLIRNHTMEAPIVIRTSGLSVDAKEMFDSIAKRAYEIFESKGRVRGRELENWLQAEAELFGRTPLEVEESQEQVTVLADVRGFTPKELEVDLEPQRVTIIGKRRTQVEQKAGASISSQKDAARLLRSIRLPVTIDAHHATARLNRGVLELDLKKAMITKGENRRAS
ncbi:MAG: Hsp20 family protein [Candidatus Acidiferrum sp.]